MAALNSTILHFVASEDNQLAAAAFGVATLLLATAVYYSFSSKIKEDEFPKLPGLQLYHAWNFFQRRDDFLNSHFRQNAGKSFSFDVSKHKVIAVTGEEARRVLYSDPRMDLSKGFKVLMGAAPKPRDIRDMQSQTSGWDMARFNKVMNRLLHKNRLTNILPTMLQDIIGKANTWGKNNGKTGRIDPFTDIFDVVFLMTARMITCNDLTTNEADLKKIGDLLTTLTTSVTPTAFILPWFPSPARVKITMSNIKMFMALREYVEARRRAEPTSDAIDVLIADGETTQDIVQFVSTVLFAGIANTGIISCWILIHLATHPEWREKCRKEIQGLISRHFGDSDSSATLFDKLNAVPISSWEDELPILDACARETHRLSFAIASIRMNAGEDIKIGGKVVRLGDFVAYPMSEVHLNEQFYPNPLKYDPGRWLRPDPVPKAAYPFLGWGAGRHPCLGMKVAKFEMRLIMAMFLMRYDYQLVDKNGVPPASVPVPNRNDSQIRPAGPALYFDFKRVME